MAGEGAIINVMFGAVFAVIGAIIGRKFMKYVGCGCCGVASTKMPYWLKELGGAFL